MKQKFMTLAVALLTIGSMTAMAQHHHDKGHVCDSKAPCLNEQCAKQNCNPCICTTPEDCNTANCGKPHCDQHRAKHGKDAKRQNPYFEGIELTADQQTQLDALKAKRGPKAEADTTAKAQRPDPREARRTYINEVKQILTPEQYVIFLENMATSPAPGQHKKSPAQMKAQKAKAHKAHECQAQKGQQCDAHKAKKNDNKE